MTTKPQTSNANALVRAIYATKPQVVDPVIFSLAPNALEAVTISVVLTPELIRAWSAEVEKDNQVMRAAPDRSMEG